MEKKYCYEYPHPAVAADCIVFAFDGKNIFLLLIERGNEPYKGCWAFPGGFMNIDETAHDAAIRELKEETGLVIKKIQQLGAFTDVDRDPRERVISIAFYSLIKNKSDNICGSDDAAKAKWFNIKDIPKLAFDHQLILNKAKNKIKTKLQFEQSDIEYLEDKFSAEEIKIIISIL
ncbi:NUDIX hydrolase [Odoribacter sp. OttesenSCG-928-L07]|nr:NUDIX hydrolase [Odoribacter sp. OttesenSCG-928-L07]